MTRTTPTTHLASPSSAKIEGTEQNSRKRSSRTLMWVMLAVIALVPVPLGSNRPIFWGGVALVIGTILLVWAIAQRRNGLGPALNLGDMQLQSWLFGSFIAFLILQVLPIGQLLFEFDFAGLEQLQVETRTISLAPGDTLMMLLRQLTYGAFFFLMLQVGSNESQRSICLDILLLTISVYAVVGLASLRMGDTILGLEKWAYKGSATGTFVNRNSFATFLGFGAVLAMTQLMDALVPFSRREDGALRQAMSSLALYSVALLLILAALVASESRMGLLVTLCGVTTVLGLAMARYPGLRFSVLVMVGCGSAATAILLLTYGAGLLHRFGELAKSSAVRLELYGQTLKLITMRPWTGFGGGAFELAFPLVHELPVNSDVVWDKAHNSYLALWSEMGVLAGSIPMILLGIVAVRILKSLLGKNGSWRALTTALGVMVVGALHSTVDFSLEIQANTMMFLAAIALGYATALKSDNIIKRHTRPIAGDDSC